MSPDRRRHRFRRPGTGNWLTETLPVLRLELAPAVRTTLTAWMRLYGEANQLPGLATGPIETRFARLREHATAMTLVVWTTPSRWAGGEGLSLRIPSLRLEFGCTLAEGHLSATKVTQVADETRPPDREIGAVGMVLEVDHVALPPEVNGIDGDDPGVALIESHFGRLAGKRWGGFVEPLRAALDAEAAEDEARTQRLTVPYGEAIMLRGGDEDVWKLTGLPVETLHELDDGEWLELHDRQGRSTSIARVIRPRIGERSLEVGVRSTADPPLQGIIRPRSRRKILDQKNAVLDELENPTGSLPHLVRLVAAPSSLPVPRAVRPDHFVNPAVTRNRSQARAVALALGLEEGQAMLIQGPPGTGKSTTAAEIDVQLILRDPGVRILVCSHSNHGTDNMLMKVLPFLDDAEERIARIGYFDRIAKEARPFYAPPDADLGDRNLIFTTIDALALQDIAGATVYDYVILDEANRAGVLDSLLALARGKRMILVGDAMQLQPVMSEAEQRIVAAASPKRLGRFGAPGKRGSVPMAPLPGPNNVIGKSLFAWLLERRFAPPAVVLLDQQNRMHPAIGELVSRVFYGGHVRTGPAAPRRGTGIPFFLSPVTWVDTRALRGNAESRAGGTSLFNVAEGRMVTSVTRYLMTHAPPGMTIGVIAAYAEQRELLRRMIGPRESFPPEREMEIDTVDAFEGREKDIMVLSLVRSNRRREIGFLNVEQRLNVAVSRARRLVVIVGDTSTLRGGYFTHLVNTAGIVGQVVPATRLLAQVSGKAEQRNRERGRSPSRRERLGHPLPPAEAGAGSPEASGLVPGTVGDGAERDHRVPNADATGLREGLGRRRRRAWNRRHARLERTTQVGEDVNRAPGAESVELHAPPASPSTPPLVMHAVPDAADALRSLPPRQRRRARLRALRQAQLGQVAETPVSVDPALAAPLPQAGPLTGATPTLPTGDTSNVPREVERSSLLPVESDRPAPHLQPEHAQVDQELRAAPDVSPEPKARPRRSPVRRVKEAPSSASFLPSTPTESASTELPAMAEIAAPVAEATSHIDAVSPVRSPQRRSPKLVQQPLAEPAPQPPSVDPPKAPVDLPSTPTRRRKVSLASTGETVPVPEPKKPARAARAPKKAQEPEDLASPPMPVLPVEPSPAAKPRASRARKAVGPALDETLTSSS